MRIMYVLLLILIFLEVEIKNIWIDIILILIILVNFIIIGKKEKEKKKQMLRNFIEEEKEIKLEKEVEIIYNKTKENIKLKFNNYKEMLAKTQQNFLAKSTELEYMNDLLQKKVSNLSTLDAIGKSVVSELNLEKIIDIILDSCLVITRVEKIALYLWDNEELKQKATRGEFLFNELCKNEKNIKLLEKVKNSKKYYFLAKKLKIEKEEILIAPLISKNKELGVLFLLKNIENRKFDKNEVQLIGAITRHLSIAINNSIMYNVLSDKEKIEKEISLAADIQKGLLPKPVGEIENFNITEYFKPAKIIGGDFYDYFVSDENEFGILIGDVSGKGMPAAMLMTLLRSIWKTLLSYEKYPGKILTRLNQIIYSDITNDMFATVFYSLYNMEEKILYYSNAGHNPIIYYNSSTGKIEEKNIRGAAIGFIKDYKYKMDKIKLSKGDILIYYTDGITEAKNENNELFGKKRLLEILFENRTETPEIIKEKIIKEIQRHEEKQNQADDITLIVAKIK
ncbi:MAG: hypothetical protein B6I28_02360 [Fusobacteriia bacterium 4572_132]|nr:MAG: hypothetical protein B6I28_02360 [Fusobacteriia bacterium 4572_132]